MSKSLWPHGLQHASLLCPPPSSGVCSDLCPLNQWWCLTSHPLSPSFPFAFNLSQHQGLFQWVSFCIRWSKYWSFSFSISPSNEYSGLISFRIVWFDLLAGQGTLKSLSSTTIRKHQFFGAQPSESWMVQLSHPYMVTGKFIALTRGTFVGKMISDFQYAI